MGKDERNSYTIKADDNLGEVQIADEVVAIIAGLAAMEVEGVASMAWNEIFIQRCESRCA